MKPKSSALKILSYAIWDQASKGDHTNEVTINRGSTEYINYILYIYTVIIIYKYHYYVCLHA